MRSMNDGYTAIWIISMGLILYMTGWQKQVADHVSRRTVIVFFAGIAVFHSLDIPLGQAAALKGSAAWAAAGAGAAMLSTKQSLQTVFVMLCTGLVGSVWLWIRVMYQADPVFVLIHPVIDGPVIAGFLAGMLADRFRMQFAIVTLAAVMAQYSQQVRAIVPNNRFVIGDWAWWDGLTIAVSAARITWNIKSGSRYAVRRVYEGITRLRGGSS